MRGAASPVRDEKVVVYISTHAPHARRGATTKHSHQKHTISTHAPHARRGIPVTGLLVVCLFLLTRLMRGAARSRSYSLYIFYISTHAPHARRGWAKKESEPYTAYFYSRASCEARLYRECVVANKENFYSRASCEARHSTTSSKKWPM